MTINIVEKVIFNTIKVIARSKHGSFMETYKNGFI